MPLIQHLGGRGRWISELEASLVYKVSSRTARLYRETMSQKKKKKKKKKTYKARGEMLQQLLAFLLWQGTAV
jgi:hypothetical protein